MSDLQTPLVDINESHDSHVEQLTQAVQDQANEFNNLSEACWCYIYIIIALNVLGFFIGIIAAAF